MSWLWDLAADLAVKIRIERRRNVDSSPCITAMMPQSGGLRKPLILQKFLILARDSNRGSTFGKGGKVPVGTLKNIRISDLVAEVIVEDRVKKAEMVYKNHKVDTTPGVTNNEKSRAGPIMITDIPGHYVEDVVLENIKISYPVHGTEEDGKRLVPEKESSYPEQFHFGVLPVWGAYIRHAKNVEFKNVELTLCGADKRNKIVLDDVEGFVEKYMKMSLLWNKCIHNNQRRSNT